jgi:hypothetical protein
MAEIFEIFALFLSCLKPIISFHSVLFHLDLNNKQITKCHLCFENFVGMMKREGNIAIAGSLSNVCLSDGF